MSPEEARDLVARMPAARSRWLSETTRKLQARSVWLAGSLGRGQGDALSDVDPIVAEGRVPLPGALLTLQRADNGPAEDDYVGAMYDLGPLTLWVDWYQWPARLPVPFSTTEEAHRWGSLKCRRSAGIAGETNRQR